MNIKFPIGIKCYLVLFIAIGIACQSNPNKAYTGYYEFYFTETGKCYTKLKIKGNGRFRYRACPTHFESRTKVDLHGNWQFSNDTLKLIYDYEFINPGIFTIDSSNPDVLQWGEYGYFKKISYRRYKQLR